MSVDRPAADHLGKPGITRSKIGNEGQLFDSHHKIRCQRRQDAFRVEVTQPGDRHAVGAFNRNTAPAKLLARYMARWTAHSFDGLSPWGILYCIRCQDVL